mmetsp:Transcript_36217/g.95455  ORF Transcript_36217/g.95455 Transcript_36217/m.95455 type:complete len:357 (+) Transcript_36217:3604-4674(+)
MSMWRFTTKGLGHEKLALCHQAWQRCVLPFSSCLHTLDALMTDQHRCSQVDATIAECIEDAFAAGYNEDHLTRLLMEAAAYVPPGMSIQAMGVGGGGAQVQSGASVDIGPAHGINSYTSTGSVGRVGVGAGAGTEACSDMSLATHPCRYQLTAFEAGSPHLGQDAGVSIPANMPLFGSNAPPPGLCMPFSSFDISTKRPEGICNQQALVTSTLSNVQGPPRPPGPVPTTGGAADTEAFTEFITLFRKEMRLARDQEIRATRFVQSQAFETFGQAQPDGLPNDCLVAAVQEVAHEDEDDYDYWPDFGLGIAQDDGQEALSHSTTSTTEGSTSELGQGESDDEDSEEDLWPMELVVGA